MAFSQWRRWLRQLKDLVNGKPQVKTLGRTRLNIESLEDRITPSTAVFKPFHVVLPSHRVSEPQLSGYVDPSTGGYTPLGIQTAYGIDALLNAGDNGAGQTIAVVDAYDDPFFTSTGTPGFSQSDLASFDSIFGLPDPPSFTKVGQLGYSNNFSTTTFPGSDPFDQWEGEESLDVEWAHSIAPQAKIILVECTDATSLMQGVEWAATPVAQGGGGATVVSMSFGTAGGYPGESAEDFNFDPTLFPGVTFLASADDSGSGQDYLPNDGSESIGQAAYPADSANVVAVGGTSLSLDSSSGAYLGEAVWNDGFDPYNDEFDATGGGISFYEPAPAYQYGLTIQNGESTVSAGGMRAAPDVSFLADPYTGVDIYDTYDGNGFYDGFADPLNLSVIGGTSLSSPCWGGLVAIADQIRVNSGESTLTGATETLPALYNIYNSSAYSQDFNDITDAASPSDNGTWTAGAGYDLDTGIGSPIANNLVPDLAGVNKLVYTSPDIGTNNYLLQQSGSDLNLYDNGALVASDPISQVTSVEIGGQTDNALTIDYTGMTTNIAVTFDGGSGDGSLLAHTLTLENGAFTNETYTYAGTGSGAIALDGQTVNYTDVTSSSNTTTVTNLAVDLPSSAQVTLQAGSPKDAVTGVGFVNSGFENPSNSLTVTTSGGNSVVQLGAMDAGFLPPNETFSGVSGDIFRLISAAAVPAQTTLTVSSVSLDLNGFSPTINALNGNGVVTDSTVSTPTLTIGNSNGSGSFSGVIKNGSGTVALAKIGTGTEILSGSNTFTGPTTVSNGTLADGANNALSTGTTLDVVGTGIFDLAGWNQQVVGVIGTNIVTDSGASKAFTVADSGTDTYAGTITSAVNLVAAGTGTLILTNLSNTYSGGTTIDGGATLQIGNGTTFGSAGTAAISILANGTLQFDSPANSSASPSIFSNAITGAGSISNISASGSLGAVEVTADNSGFTGALKITGGSYQPGSASAFGSPATINVSGTGQFYFGAATTLTVNASVTISTLGYTDNTGAIRFAGPGDVLAGTVIVSGASRVSALGTTGNISGNITGANTLQIGSGTGADTIIFTGSNNYGSTIINASATLQIGAGTTAGTLGTGSVTDSGALVFDRSDSYTLAVGNTISGASGTLTQIGGGTLILPAGNNSTYGGATTISAGILEVDGAITSAVTVAANATLTGAGSTGAVTGNLGGALYLGAALSSLSAGALNLQTGSDFNVRINSYTSYSSITASSVTLGANAALNLSALAGFVPTNGGVFTIVNNTGASDVSGTFIAGTGLDAVSPGTPLLEGTIISENFLGSGHIATITYKAGTNQHCIAIIVPTTLPLNYTGSSGANPHHFVLDQNISGSVPTLEIWDNGLLVASQATSVTGVVQIGVAAGLDATLTIDFTNPFTVPVIFDGGTGAASPHTLTLENGSYTTATFNDSTVSSGTITLDGESITYADLTAASPAIIDATTQANLVVNLPASAQGLLENDAGSLSGVSQINTTNSSFADTAFENPAAAFTVNGLGNSLIELGAMDSAFSPAAETFTGLASDTFQFASASAVPSTTSVTLTTATLDLNGLNPTIDALNGNGPVTNSSNVAGSVLSVGANGGSGAFSGSIQDGASEIVALTKLGSGTETLSGASNTYSGPTTISAGTLQAGVVNALSAHSDVTDNANLDLNGLGQSIGALNGNGSVTSSVTGTPTLTIGADDGAGTFSGIIKNGSATSVALAKTGSGTEILNSTANIFSGGTTVSAGILQIGDGANFGSIGTAGISISVNGTLTFDSPANSTDAAKTFANSISGAGGISVISANPSAGLGAVVVTGANTNFTGALNITGGSYQLGVANSLGAPSGINVSGTGQFYFGTVASVTVNAPVAISTTGYMDNGGTTPPLGAIRFSHPGDVLAGALTVTSTAVVSAYLGSGTIQGNITGAGTLEIGSGFGVETIILTGGDGAATTINGSATLQVGNGGTAGAITIAAVTDNGTLSFQHSDTVSLGASISGTGALTQAGAGTLILPSTNTYSYGGGTTVSNGALQIDGSIASNVTVSGAGHLTGTGATGNVTTTANTTVVAPGDPPNTGTLTAGALTLSTGAAFNVGISGVNTASQVIASGAIGLNNAVLNLATVGAYTPSASDVYTIIVNNSGSAVNGTFVAGAGIDNFAPGTPLYQGADLSDDFMGTGKTATLDYNAGPNGDSVAVEVSAGGQFRYNNPGAGNHNFLLKENTSTGNFELYDTTISTTVPVATQPITLTTVIDVNLDSAPADDAALTIDYGGGQFTNKVKFDGGTGSGTLARTLTFENTSATTAFSNESFTYTGANTGDIQLDSQPVLFYDLSCVGDATSITAANVSFTLPAAAQATFGDDGHVGNGISKLSSQNTGFAATTFADPSATLTVQTSGSSLVQLGAMDSGFSATSEIFTGQATDQFRLTSIAALHSITTVSLSGVILDLHGISPTFDALNGAGTITNGAGVGARLTIGANGSSGSFSGVIQNGVGVTSLAKSGAGAETLDSANTYTGTTTINDGVINVGVANALPIGTSLTVNDISGVIGYLDLSGNNQQVGSMTGAGIITDSGAAATFTVNNGVTDAFAGQLSGDLALVKQAAGALTLSHANSYGGTTTVSAGTLKQGSAGAVPGNAIIVNGTLDLGGFGLAVPSVTGSGTVTDSSVTVATFTVENTAADQFAGAITGRVALTEAGGGTLILTKASTYAGATTISAGTITDGVANALPIATALNVSGTLDLSGFAQQVASITGSGTVTDSSAAAVFTVANSASDTFAGTLSGALAFTKFGVGVLTLNNADSYTGQTTINSGTLQVGNSNAIPDTSNVTDNAILDLHGNSAAIGALTGNTTGTVTSSVAGAIVFTIGGSNSNGTFAGLIKNGTGTLGLSKIGTGVETLSGGETFTGATELDSGTLTVNGTLYSGATVGIVDLANSGVVLNGSGIVRAQVAVLASSAVQNTDIDAVTITVPIAGGTGITVASTASFVHIGVTKGVVVNGGNTTSTGILVYGSAMIFNSNVSGHLVDIDVNGGTAVLQKDTLNAGATHGIGWTGLRAEDSAIVDAGQIAANATPLPSPPYAAGNVGLYGDITGLFSGTPLGSSAHSTGGNIFNGYTASTATTDPTTVAQAIRDLNTGVANFGALGNGVETSFTYGGAFQLGRMDLTAQADIFNGVAKPTSAVIKSLVFDGQRDSDDGFVVYGVPSMTVIQSGAPSYVAPGASNTITINYANTGMLPTFGYITEYVPTNESVNLAADPGWISLGGGVYAYNLGLLSPGTTGSIQFNLSVIAKPTSVTITTEAAIEPDLFSNIVVAVNYIRTTTTVSPNNVRWY